MQDRSHSASAAPDSPSRSRPYFCGSGPLIFLLVLAIVGAFAAGFLTYRHVLISTSLGAPSASILCKPGGMVDCDAVLQTRYSVLMNHVPSATLGLMGFIFALWLIIGGLAFQGLRKMAVSALVVYFVAALGFSWYFIYLMMFQIAFICTWCIVVHIVNFTSVIFLMWLAISKKNDFLLPEITSIAERGLFIVGGGFCALAVFFFAGFVEQTMAAQTARRDFDEMVNDPVIVRAIMANSPKYDVPIMKDDPVFGSPQAPFSLVVFTDFACPVCPKVEATLRKIVGANSKYLKLVYKTFPLSTECNKYVGENLHPTGCPAAVAAWAAYYVGGNEAFLKYADTLFANRRLFAKNPWLDFARRQRLNPEEFEKMLGERSPARSKLAQDLQQGVKARVTGTPTIFFEGKKIPDRYYNPYLLNVLEDLIHANHPEYKGLHLRPL